MKTTLAALLLAFGLATFAHAQDADCSDYDWATTANVGYGAANGHISGDHMFAGGAHRECDYEDAGLALCASFAYADMYVGASDEGLLTTGIGYHVSRGAVNWGDASNNGGAASTSGTGMEAWEWCLTNTCTFGVSASPISFPSTAVWAATQTTTVACAAVANPDGGGSGGSGGDCSCDDTLCGAPECELFKKASTPAANPAAIVKRGDQQP